ncbi:PrgI family protein [Streptomyces sp. SL13]|uniref:PrgI family protein n=1 Tax=Streptantibioticus silvisoli TaxID=2705255 RepID=A0AA90HDH0_9ACTN|nr:PrgI family protein [Streptantibioticus silvisoli]MDI5973715.1 PrgI family protein [Streptantibioticus silvisoli]
MDQHQDATRIPADVSRPDRLLGPFTARQTGILAVAALGLYAGWWAARLFMAPLAYGVMVTPIAGAVAAVALGRREGIGLDHFLLAALAHARTPKRRVHAPEGVPPLPAVFPRRWARGVRPPTAMHLPCDAIGAGGVLDLRGEGKAAVATCSTVNFGLRSIAEQQGLTAAFANWLNSLTGPTQLLVRCHRLDLTPLADALHDNAAALLHPALERAARAHADFLADLAVGSKPLSRQIVLVAREPATSRGPGRPISGERALQRLQEAARALAAAEITIAPLGAEQSAGLISLACNPETPPHPTNRPEGGLT